MKHYKNGQLTAKIRAMRVGATALAAVLLANGCALQRVSEGMDKGKEMAEQASTLVSGMRAQKQGKSQYSTIREGSGLYIDETPIPIGAVGGKGEKSPLDCVVSFTSLAPTTISEFADDMAKRCKISVRVTQEALQQLNGVRPAGAPAARASGQAGAGLPAPKLNGGGNAIALSNGVSAASGSFGQGGVISGIQWHQRPLRGLLDLVTAKVGLGYKVDGSGITIYYVDTQVFNLDVLPGNIDLNTTVQSGKSNGSATSGGATQASNQFDSSGSRQSTKLDLKTDMAKEIQETLNALVTPNVGNAKLNTATMSITVSDRADGIARVESYVKAENKRLTRQVILSVQAFMVTLKDEDSVGLNWDAVYSALNRYGINFKSAFSVPTGGASASVGIVSPTSPWAGTKAMIDALSTQGRVSTVTTTSVMTLNLQVAPLQVGRNSTYVASSSSTAVSNVGNQISLVPGNFTTGYNMSLLPLLLDGQEMLLRYDVNLNSLLQLRTIDAGSAKMEAPDLDNRILSQKVKLKAGQTWVLSGFEQMGDDTSRSGTGDARFWLLGGNQSRKTSKDVMVFLVTPVVVE
ncbi:PilN family type IVB pilus formation outer membrane protein [Cupriavidus sp. TMH.W2]|uniref:PilN family type IVB pilus formation outer membrane protein n=1 Tax=Cupriavidus sp. TMH.W2 TaxID=3434465 RepID=UPI003D7709CA